MSSSLASPAMPTPSMRHRPGAGSADGLTRGQLGAVVGAIGLAHVVGVWALLQVPEVRSAAAEVAPIFVNFIAPPAPPQPAEPVPPPPPPQVKLPPPKPEPPRETLVTAAPTPAPAPFVAEPPPPPLPAPAPPAPPPVAEAPPAPPAPPPAPKTIPASAVQYLVPPDLEYPRTSKRLGETGRVMVRAFIDETGAVREVQVHRSSSFHRLDDEAVRAVRRARFKPYIENGRATAGWAFIPLTFELEN